MVLLNCVWAQGNWQTKCLCSKLLCWLCIYVMQSQKLNHLIFDSVVWLCYLESYSLLSWASCIVDAGCGLVAALAQHVVNAVTNTGVSERLFSLQGPFYGIVIGYRHAAKRWWFGPKTWGLVFCMLAAISFSPTDGIAKADSTHVLTLTCIQVCRANLAILVNMYLRMCERITQERNCQVLVAVCSLFRKTCNA